MIRRGFGQSKYVCPLCGTVSYRAGRFVLMPENVRSYKGEELRLPEFCCAVPQDPEAYAGICRGVMVWTPETAANDLLPADFGPVDVDGQQRQFSSLSEVRTFERESQQRARNGEGSPYSFRKLSQDRSNHDRNTFAGSSFERATALTPSRKTVQGRPITGDHVPSADRER